MTAPEQSAVTVLRPADSIAASEYLDSKDRSVLALSVAFARHAAEARAGAHLLAEMLVLALNVAESWIHDQLDGTSSLDSELAVLEPARAALAAYNTPAGLEGGSHG